MNTDPNFVLYIKVASIHIFFVNIFLVFTKNLFGMFKIASSDGFIDRGVYICTVKTTQIFIIWDEIITRYDMQNINLINI